MEGASNTLWGKDSLSTDGARETREPNTERVKSGPYVVHKINSKWVKDLDVKTETVQLLEENREELQPLILVMISQI